MNADAFRRWYRYERDVHALVLESLETVPPDRRSDPDYPRTLDLLGHVVTARRMWLARFGVLDETPADLFPRGWAPERLRAELAEIEDLWERYLAELDSAELRRSFEYAAFEGGRFRSTIADILTQLFGHSWYHRGQIGQLVRALGGEPAVTDFVYWSREPVEA